MTGSTRLADATEAVDLLDRGDEVTAISGAIAGATAGSGRVLVVEGQAGIGKTALLRLVRGRGAGAGMQVHESRGGPLEREFPFGVVRQLFERALARLTAGKRRALLGGAAAGAMAVIGVDAPLAQASRLDLLQAMHGLYWLCANLAETQPLMLTVDDAHSADAESLRWLSYMANRADDLPLLLAVAMRPEEQAADPLSLAAVSSAPAATVLRPAPLSDRSSARVVRALRGADAAAAFCRACHDAAGGNPFYLRELVLETARQEIEPVADEADRVGTLGPRTISSATLVRLARLPEPAAALAQMVCILGLDAEVRHAAALAEVDMKSAEGAADALAAAGILEPHRPLNFIHPVVGAAIYADMAEGVRSQAHARAADRLADKDEDLGAVGSHLLLVDPAADETVRGRLERAADEALARGAPATAARYLRRAVEETPEPDARAPLLARTGQAELMAGEPSAVEHLSEAVRHAEDPGVLVEAAGLLLNALAFAGCFEDADELARQTIERLGRAPEDPLVLRLEALRLQVTAFQGRFAASVNERLPGLLKQADGGSAAGRLILIVGATWAAIRVERCDEVPALVVRGLAGGRFLAEETGDSLAAGQAVCALAFVDQLSLADDVLAALFEDAQARNSVLAYVGALVWRGWVSLRRGQIPAALADERAALDLCEQHGLRFPLPWAQAFLAAALLEGGQAAEAEALVDSLALDEVPVEALHGMALDVRGRVRLARGRHDEGVADLQCCGERHEAIGQHNPNATHWRSSLAVALGRDSPRALPLVEVELELARRSGCPRAVGVALRAEGLLRGGDEGVQLLRESVTVLDSSPASLEHARALSWLGAELRRQGRRAVAREPLRRALDIADRLGAERLAAEAQAELAAAGGRPRRRRLSGVESLTPTERRVAEMAAGGLRNKEIAQALFVSRKTVEMHLGNAYSKLDIHARDELAFALKSQGGSP
jgi:DNA-binding CsgD family transcriptional regulator